MKCTGKNKQGKRCGRDAALGHTKCNRHGAKRAKGIDVSAFKHGQYSKYLPQRLLDRYYELEENPELLNVQRHMILLEVRLTDLMEELAAGGSRELWRSLKDTADRLMACRYAGDAVRMSECLNILMDKIRKGNKDYQVWSEVSSVIEQHRRLSETEQRRLVTMQQHMTVEEVMLSATVIMELVRKNVSNPQELAAIAKGYQAFVQRNNPPRLVRGG